MTKKGTKVKGIKKAISERVVAKPRGEGKGRIKKREREREWERGLGMMLPLATLRDEPKPVEPGDPKAGPREFR